MESKDLMIGDWVYNKNIDKPMQVYPMMFSQMFRQRPEATTEDYNIFPVPLTPEILEKNGFRYNDLPFVQSWEQFGLSLYLGGDGYRINCGQNVAMVIDSVHQLQQALRLCEIEKQITL